MGGRTHSYGVQTEGLPLSLKCMANGRARYVVGKREITVDDGGWLIVNEAQPYSIEIDSPTLVETFIVWFPTGWAEEVQASMITSADRLLGDWDPSATSRTKLNFFERYSLNDSKVAPLARRLREKFNSGAALDDGWLEEKLRELLAGMLDVQTNVQRQIARLPAERASTREELWRRLDRARDFIHARCDTPITLTDAAQVAALSPYHFLRAFKAAFAQTPHAWLTACRLERAKLLLGRTDLPVTQICFSLGYESLGAFSTWFQRLTGRSPRAWRQASGTCRAIRNFREVLPPKDLLSSES